MNRRSTQLPEPVSAQRSTCAPLHSSLSRLGARRFPRDRSRGGPPPISDASASAPPPGPPIPEQASEAIATTLLGLSKRSWPSPLRGSKVRRHFDRRAPPIRAPGHQASGWMSGLLWARDLDLEYVGQRLPEDKRGLFAVASLERHPADRSRKVVRLPATEDERDGTSLIILRDRVARARRRLPRQSIEFRLPLDHPRYDHVPAGDTLRAAALAGVKGTDLERLEAGDDYIALHVRRPARANEIGPDTHPDRWLTSEWYAALVGRLRLIESLRAMPIRVYSLGDEQSFEALSSLPSVQLHLNGDRDADFVGLAGARLLVAAPSSFSFNAALITRGAVLARVPWWHHIPNEGRWAHLDGNGAFDESDLRRALDASFSLRPRNLADK